EKIKNHALLPVLIVLLVLSIESVIVTILEFIELTLGLIDSPILSYSDEFLDLVILTGAKGVGILFLVFFFIKKLKLTGIEESHEIKLHSFLGVVLLYVGCIIFLIHNLDSSLFIIPDKAPFIEVWPKIRLSKSSIELVGYQIFLLLLLLVVIPIYEELLFRKAVIQALLKKQMTYGQIIIISSLIYAIFPFIYNLVMYTEKQAFFDLLIRMFSGVSLAIVFLKTLRIKYTYILRLLVNCIIYLQFLTMFHPLIAPSKELYSIIIIILTSIGIIIFFYLIFDSLATYRSTLTAPPWLASLLDFRFSKDELKPLLQSIFIFLPIFPFGPILFTDHLVLYTDLGGIFVKTMIKCFFNGIIILICGFQIKNDRKLFKVFSEPASSLELIITKNYHYLQVNYREMLTKCPRFVFRHLGFLIISGVIILGMISPIFIFSMGAKIFTRVPGLGTIIEVNMDLDTGQNPFFSYSRVEMKPKSPLIPIIPIPRQKEEVFYFLKHTNGQWNFLPDTFMAHPGDWLHGLMTVGTWFLILGLLCFVFYEFSRNRRITAGIGLLCFTGAELLWYLFTLGIGSIPSGEEPPHPSTNQTLSQFFQMDFELDKFFILPLGLIILLIATAILLFSGIQYHYKERRNSIQETSERNLMEDLINFPK
ncbi:MAG: type II CAAX prenyl endopeptidase Rce1 family protein, partial [Candidatus Thorarchaeota archaeon]